MIAWIPDSIKHRGGGLMQLISRSRNRRGRICFGALILVLVSSFDTFQAALGQEPAGHKPSAIAVNPFASDPIHQAGLEASANKIVFVLGEGFGRRPLMSLERGLAGIGLIKGRHYEIMMSAASPKESGVLYIGGQLMKNSNNQVYIFDQYRAEDAISALRLAIKSGVLRLSVDGR